MYAAMNDHKDIVTLLIKHGAEIHARDNVSAYNIAVARMMMLYVYVCLYCRKGGRR